jgi:hypothetical protein
MKATGWQQQLAIFQFPFRRCGDRFTPTGLAWFPWRPEDGGLPCAGVVVAGERIEARTILWAAGVAASPAAKWLQAEADRAGRARRVGCANFMIDGLQNPKQAFMTAPSRKPATRLAPWIEVKTPFTSAGGGTRPGRR